jgi:hypothetical protein
MNTMREDYADWYRTHFKMEPTYEKSLLWDGYQAGYQKATQRAANLVDVPDRRPGHFFATIIRAPRFTDKAAQETPKHRPEFSIPTEEPARTQQVVDQCRAVIALAQKIASYYDGTITHLNAGGLGYREYRDMVERKSTAVMQRLGDIANAMSLFNETDQWMIPIFDGASILWPPEKQQRARLGEPMHRAEITMFGRIINGRGTFRFSNLEHGKQSTDRILKPINPLLRPFCRVRFVAEPE